MTKAETLDAFIAPNIRAEIETRYYARINEQSQLSEVVKDPLFLENPSKHVALFSDHGVVHVRDVAGQVLHVLKTINGVLIPKRLSARFGWMEGFAVVVAYMHDIGMVNMSAFGRAMHPEYAAQAALSSDFDAIMMQLWTDDLAGLASRLAILAKAGKLAVPPQTVLREIAAMSICHSKSKVPVELLNDHAALRDRLVSVAQGDLSFLYCQQRLSKARRAAESDNVDGLRAVELSDDLRAAQAAMAACDTDAKDGSIADALDELYSDFERDGFAWLTSTDTSTQELVEDIIDTLRALRCADALRQRGTVLKTSGNYEVFVDQRSANAIYALRLDEEHLYLLELPDRIGAGEANIASSELDKDGNLRISFYHGMFVDHETVLYAAGSAALVVNDIQADVIESFYRNFQDTPDALRKPGDIVIMLESVDDNPAFADLVCLSLLRLNAIAAAQTRVVPSLQANSATERAHYLQGSVIDWTLEERIALLGTIARYGHQTDGIDPYKGLSEARQITLYPGETLIEAGGPAGFVYIPQGDGLKILPLGGYQGFSILPWIPVGVTGVIRGAVRNANVVAEQELTVLAIPKDIYLKHWHRTYDQAQFLELFQS
jgi:hypothetical protein